MKLSKYVKRITDPILDIVCETKLSPGETLTVLKQAKLILDTQIADFTKQLMNRILRSNQWKR